VEHLHCAGEKLLEKNAIGRHALSMRCMMEAPQPKFEASETSTVSASERGWAKSGVIAQSKLQVVKCDVGFFI